jgi:hypothetical protein
MRTCERNEPRIGISDEDRPPTVVDQASGPPGRTVERPEGEAKVSGVDENVHKHEDTSLNRVSSGSIAQLFRVAKSQLERDRKSVV